MSAVERERLLSIRFADRAARYHHHLATVRRGFGHALVFTHEGFDLDSPLGKSAYEGMKPGWPALLDRIETVAGDPAPQALGA